MKWSKKETMELLRQLLAFANHKSTTKFEIRNKIADLLILFENI